MHVISNKRQARVVSPSIQKMQKQFVPTIKYTYIQPPPLSLRRRRKRDLDLMSLHRAPALPSRLLNGIAAGLARISEGRRRRRCPRWAARWWWRWWEPAARALAGRARPAVLVPHQRRGRGGRRRARVAAALAAHGGHVASAPDAGCL